MAVKQQQSKARSAGKSAGQKKSVQEYAEEYQRLADSQLPLCPGFSARLNMLWDLAGAAPGQTEGRVLGVMGINSGWRESDVRNWLQKDVLPPRLELHNMVKFLVAQLEDTQDAGRWEAFLVYGSPIVSSPISHSMYREDKTRREIASMIFAQLTAEYAIPPSAYDADKVFQRCLTLMQKFNIYELQDFQSGHLEPFRNYMFPSE
ncbi:MAG: hypothetical protein H6984_06135 [Pseudomonadales bacterium]|nr:hypothetical protein [Pseudomonadales bacterium]MCP5192427.1 hypothetical protein [Pseudomonadales bacterium]